MIILVYKNWRFLTGIIRIEAVEKNIQAADLEKPYIYLVAPKEPFTSDKVPLRTKSGNISVNPKIKQIMYSASKIPRVGKKHGFLKIT